MRAYFLKRVVYFGTILAVAALTILLYSVWWERNSLETPDLVVAVPYVYTERFPVKGALIWEESIVRSPAEGRLLFAEPGPRRVARGEAVAVVESASGRATIRSDSVGYFIPGLDGAEGEWRYSDLWPGLAPLPASTPLACFSAEMGVRRGDPIGKLVPQPQELRCVLYTDITPSLERDITAGFVRVKTKRRGWASKAAVRASSFFET